MGDVVAHHLEIGVIEEMGDVAARASVIVVNAEHLAVCREQTLAKKATEEAGCAGDENAFRTKIQGICHSFPTRL